MLLRALTEDDATQSVAAQGVLADAEAVALTIPALCELVWVLSQGYKIPKAQIADSIRRLLASTNAVMNRPAVQAGLDMLDAGGDFADGAIAYEGRWLGAETFVSFDRQAVRLIKASGAEARLLL